MKKNLLIFLISIAGFFCKSQITYPNLVSSLPHDTCLNKQFSMVFYIVLDSNYSVGQATPANLNTMVSNLNSAFKRICVSFLNCSTVVIPHYPYQTWNNQAHTVVPSNWYAANTINVYIPTSITTTAMPANESSGFCDTANGNSIIVIEAASLIAGNNVNFASHVPAHVLGHFFGLANTFDETGNPATPPPPASQISHEYFDRTNCYSNGDGFCDTEADPYPHNFNVNVGPCYYITGSNDGYGKYYVPPVDNIMSNYGCRCRFTQEQYNFMAGFILKYRLTLH